MKRRDALKYVGLGLTAGLTLPPWLSACSNDDPKPAVQYDGIVGIIGAGAAGLYAADILATQGIKVVVFEASDRMGGRVQTLRSTDQPTSSLIFNAAEPLNNDFPLELGADKIYGSDSSWGDLLKKRNVPVTDLRALAAGDSYLLDNALKLESDLAADSDFLAARAFVNSLKDYTGANVSVQAAAEAAGIDARVHAILNGWIGNRFGTSNDKISIVALAEGMRLITHNDALQIITGNPAQNALLSRFNGIASKVQLNTPIKSINYSGDVVTVVDTNNRTTTVNKLIVTAPLSILKAGDIQFTPALPARKSSAMDRMGMDASVRVVLEFKKNVWNESSVFLYGGATAPEYFSCALGGRGAFNKFLSITVNGAKAAELSALGTDMVPAIISELDGVLNGAASSNVMITNSGIASVIKDWSKEPYIKGGTSYSLPGGTNDDRVALAEPIDNKVYFAGEATDITGSFGTISGALQSAYRASMEVIDSIVTPG